MWTNARGRNGERGAVAIVVAVCLVMLVTVAAVAIDVGRVLYVRSNLQLALDGAMKAAGAAAVSLPSSQNNRQIQVQSLRIAKAYIASNFQMSADLVRFDSASTSDFNVTYTPSDPNNPNANNEDSVLGTLNASVPTVFAGVLGIANVDIHLTARVKRPRPAPLEMAIIADLTPSMAEQFGSTTKVAALKTSATAMVTTLMKGDYVKVGLLPYAMYMRLPNIDDYYTAASMTSKVPWLRISANPMVTDCDGQTCTSNPGTCYNDGVPYSCTVKNCSCIKTKTRPWFWSGCLYYRPAVTGAGTTDPRTTIANPATVPYYTVSSQYLCDSLPVMTDLVSKGQTYSSGGRSYTAEDYLKLQITGFTTATVNPNAMGTYIPTSLIWAWNMLTAETSASGAPDNNFPLNSGYTAQQITQLGVRRAILLITDGNNSFFPSPRGTPNVYDAPFKIQATGQTATQQATNLARNTSDMAQICQNIRAAGIEIYIIGLQVNSDLAYRSLLQTRCASNGGDGYFFSAENPSQLTAAFEQISLAFSYNSLTQ